MKKKQEEADMDGKLMYNHTFPYFFNHLCTKHIQNFVQKDLRKRRLCPFCFRIVSDREETKGNHRLSLFESWTSLCYFSQTFYSCMICVAMLL